MKTEIPLNMKLKISATCPGDKNIYPSKAKEPSELIKDINKLAKYSSTISLQVLSEFLSLNFYSSGSLTSRCLSADNLRLKRKTHVPNVVISHLAIKVSNIEKRIEDLCEKSKVTVRHIHIQGAINPEQVFIWKEDAFHENKHIKEDMRAMIRLREIHKAEIEPGLTAGTTEKLCLNEFARINNYLKEYLDANEYIEKRIKDKKILTNAGSAHVLPVLLKYFLTRLIDRKPIPKELKYSKAKEQVSYPAQQRRLRRSQATAKNPYRSASGSGKNLTIDEDQLNSLSMNLYKHCITFIVAIVA